MSDLNIRMNLETSAAEAAAAAVQGDLNKLKTDAEKPIKINVDASQLAGATGGAGKLREALGNVQAAALDELSQKAGQLGASLGGVAGSVAEVAIKSAAAFGPIGIAITAVLAGLALVKQAVDENNAATERSDAISSALAEANNTLGGSYSTVVAAANAATTAEAARLAVAQQQQAIIQRQIAIMGQAGTTVAAAGLDLAFQRISDSTKTSATSFALLTREMVANLVHSGTAAQQQAFLGQSFHRSTDAVVAFRQEIELTKRILAEQAATALRAAMARRADLIEQVREAQQRVNSNISDREHIAAVRDLDRAQRMLDAGRQNLRTVTAAYTASQRELGTATRDTTQATREAVEEEEALATARRLIERQNAAAAAAASAETGAQRRAGIEALRVAEQGLTTAGQEISVREQQTRAEQALAFAVGETARARAASARGGQTTAERTALVTALNNETTARDGVAAATARQMQSLIDFDNKQRQLATDRAAVSERERTNAEGDKARNLANFNAAQTAEDAVSARSSAQKAELNKQEAARAEITKQREEQLAGSAGKLGEAQIAAAFAAAAAGENAGVAMQAALKASLLALAQESAIKALYATATGLFQLATLNPAAGTTLASAAMFAGVAVAAGVGGALIPSPASAPTGAGAGSAAMAGPAGATPMRSGGADAGEAPKNITINFSAFQSNEQAQALIVRSLREAGYNGRARVGSSFSSERR